MKDICKKLRIIILSLKVMNIYIYHKICMAFNCKTLKEFLISLCKCLRLVDVTL